MKRISNVAVVRNANAGKHMGRRALVEGSLAAIREELGGPGRRLAIFATKDLRDLDEAAGEISAGEYDLVVSIGGDGTTSKLMSRLLPKVRRAEAQMPAFMIVPAGTMNVVPASLRNTTGEAALRPIGEVVRNIRFGLTPPVAEIHALEVNGEHGFIYAAGFIAAALARYYEHDRRGIPRVMKVALATVLEETARLVGIRPRHESLFKPFEGFLGWNSDDGDGCAVSGGLTSVIAATVERIQPYMRTTRRAHEKPGHCHLLATEAGYWRHLVGLPGLIRGSTRLFDTDVVARDIGIRFYGPTPRMLDGELLPPLPESMVDQLACGPLLTFIRA